MRIAVITATPRNVALGSGTHVAIGSLMHGVERLGHQVDLVGPANPSWTSRFGIRRFAFNGRIDRDLVEHADIVLGIDMDGWALAGSISRPFVAYPHGIIAEEARFERGWTRLAFRMQAAAEGRSVRKADLVLALSHHSARRLVELYQADRARIGVAQPGVDLWRWSDALQRATTEGRGGPTVLCVSRMYRRKNIAALLRAASLLRTEVPNLQLRIVGDGPERARLHRLATSLRLGGLVSFTGQIGFDRLAAEYAGCDVFCLPTLQEGFGIAFVEAMAAGKPIVACRASATPELVKHQQNGLLIEPGDDRALADALTWVIQNPGEAKRMGNANKEAVGVYDLPAAAQRLVDAIAPVANGEFVPGDCVTSAPVRNYVPR